MHSFGQLTMFLFFPYKDSIIFNHGKHGTKICENRSPRTQVQLRTYDSRVNTTIHTKMLNRKGKIGSISSHRHHSGKASHKAQLMTSSPSPAQGQSVSGYQRRGMINMNTPETTSVVDNKV